MMVKLLRGFAVVWILLSITIMLWETASIWRAEGIIEALKLWNPFNVKEQLRAFLVLSPGLIAFFIAFYIEKHHA